MSWSLFEKKREEKMQRRRDEWRAYKAKSLWIYIRFLFSFKKTLLVADEIFLGRDCAKPKLQRRK